MLSPYEADNLEFTTYISTEPPKYVKLHVIAESNPNLREMTEQSSLCLLPTKHAISPTFFVSGDRRQFEGNLRRPERRSNIVFEAIYQVSEPW